MASRYITPINSAPIVDLQTGRATDVWQRYLQGIQELSGRTSANVDPLPASPSVEQIATAFNALLTAMQDANQQEAP